MPHIINATLPELIAVAWFSFQTGAIIALALVLMLAHRFDAE